MRLKSLGLLRPDSPERGGTLAGWFVPGGLLADATEDRIRVWDVARRKLLRALSPRETSLGRPSGAIAAFPRGRRIVTVHENAEAPYSRPSVALWRLPEMIAVLTRRALAGTGPGVALGSGSRHLLAFCGQVRGPSSPGLVVLDLDLNVVARWREPPRGEPLAIEEKKWIADPRCRLGEPGVDLRTYGGRTFRRIADDAPITHMVRCREGRLWLFQEEGILDLWDLGTLSRVRRVDLEHDQSLREDLPLGAVVSMDDFDEQAAATLGADGRVKFWSLPDWKCVLERPFEMIPLWIDVDRERKLVAVGFLEDAIEIFGLSP